MLTLLVDFTLRLINYPAELAITLKLSVYAVGLAIQIIGLLMFLANIRTGRVIS
jgi:hypothetical protein